MLEKRKWQIFVKSACQVNCDSRSKFGETGPNSTGLDLTVKLWYNKSQYNADVQYEMNTWAGSSLPSVFTSNLFSTMTPSFSVWYCIQNSITEKHIFYVKKYILLL